MLATTTLQAQPFGRFGYGDTPAIPGIVLERDGFRARHAAADKFRFNSPAKIWKVAQTSDLHQLINLNDYYGNPSKLRIDLSAPGFSMYCPQGLSLRVGSTAAPYLSWGEGSAGAGVPTPDVPWVVVSFADAQPPFILGLPQNKTSFEVAGKPGAWVLQAKQLQGWIRVGLPAGTTPVQANTAHALGVLSARAKEIAPLFTAFAPELKKLDVRGDSQSVTATWTFDRPGAVLPSPLFAASIGGYAPRVDTEVREIDAPTEEGPLQVSGGPRLTVRFPVKRIPTGRAVAPDAPPPTPTPTVAASDIPQVVQLGFQNLVSVRSVTARDTALGLVGEYLSKVEHVAEPNTNQRLPFAADGRGLDLAAAYALLMQSTISTVRPASTENALLTSVAWRMDWGTWRLWMEDRAAARRAAGLAALAGALCSEPERRLFAAMLEAGLAAERGLQTWNRRRGLIAEEAPLPEPMPSMRSALFTANEVKDDEGRFALGLLSPLRVYGWTPLNAATGDTAYRLSWPAGEVKPDVLTLAAGFPITLEPFGNIAASSVASSFGFTELRYTPKGAGICEADLTLPGFAEKLPAGVAVPAYRETAR
ncbi:MAG TPA: hypothetical protein VGE01_00345 [Fimbriimonas sp.]